ncbi:MAG: MATE family efflux transporter, partial [Clostridia bacterium]|nr:MATE family efflux transporter [Clostridia bacterium]
MKRTQLSLLVGDAPFWRRVLKLGLPIALQNLLSASYSLVDTLMIAGLGSEALSAVGMAVQWGFLFNMVLFGICSAASMFVSQYWGSKEYGQIKRTAGLTVLLTCSFCGVFVLCLALFPEAFVGFLTDDPIIAAQAVDYLRIIVWAYPATAITLTLGAVLRACEYVKLPTFASAITTVLNVFFNYVFIFGKLGAPAMGIRGAALASLISAWVGPVILILVSLLRRNILYGKPKEFFSISRSFFALFLRRATPVVFNEGAWGLGTFLLNAIYTNYDPVGYAARTILSTFENIAFVAFVGLCNAACI